MRALDRKLLRDLARLWAQSLAIALVMACGVATLILAIGTYQSLDETRSAYYERYRFGDIFAAATRAPKSLARSIAAIDGVAAVEARIASPVILDIPGMREPATGLAISVPASGDIAVNDLFLREGRMPEAAREVVVNANFADAHHFTVGSTFDAIVNGSKIEVTVVGVVLSPEYIYALGPGDMMPDNRRFGVLWMQEAALAPLFNLDGAFNSVSLRLLPGASQTAVIDKLDLLLAPYGGTGAYGRKDQLSNAFLDGELVQLKGMAEIIPPIFLAVSAFLINMILSRLISLEREQIGLLKALGYGRFAVVWHYLKLVLVIAAVGTLIGVGAGNWLGPRPDAPLCGVLQLPVPDLPRDARYLSDRGRHQLRRRDRRRAAGGVDRLRASRRGRHASTGAAGISPVSRRRGRPLAHLLATHHHGAPPCAAPSGARGADRCRHRLLGGAGRGGSRHAQFGQRHDRRDLLSQPTVRTRRWPSLRHDRLPW